MTSYGNKKSVLRTRGMTRQKNSYMKNPEIWNLMKSGERYDASHPELLRRLDITRMKLWEYN
ncbi:MAG: hypothetical protein K2K05_10010, partial [Muribaculaceae bacterium]|nr:hypothetical protein [Muribaculaceae bacterium]